LQILRHFSIIYFDHSQEDTLSEAEKLLPLLMGADGVMVPFRPEPGTPKGKTQWREVKIGIFARLQRGVNATGSAWGDENAHSGGQFEQIKHFHFCSLVFYANGHI
jgi:hypothetical protein